MKGPLVALLALLSAATAQQSSFVNWETPHVTPLALTPDGTRLLAVNLADNRLEVFRTVAGSLVHRASIPVGLDPVSVRVRTDGEAWVVNQLSDSISVVDLATRNVVATLETDDKPADVVFAGSPERAFVTCSQPSTVLVFDPADLTLAPTRLTVDGEEPRALAVSPDGGTVYAALFESGNRTTVLGGGIADATFSFPPNVVSDPAGPYGGVNPPPNAGVAFDPPKAAGLPTPPPVSLIVRQNANGDWLDDNGGDWTALVSGPQAALSGRPVGWTLLDHDVALIDANALTISYVDHLMNIDMALGVNPATGDVAVVGTEATNEIRFEPNLTGIFVRSHLALFDPVAPLPAIVDLNDHLDYTTGQVVQTERDKTLADPRGIAWNAAGTKAYVTGMGSNNVVVIDATGARAGLSATIEVGEGPTGIVVDEASARLYVMNKFDASISVLDVATELETARVPFHDPTPAAIRVGRKHLYDAHETSGLGLTACAACHVDARMDRLGWDLGDPSGAMDPPNGQNLGGNIPGLSLGFEDFHPMKGPMLTQSMQDIIGKEPHHWRGDRDGIEAFGPAFEGLLGDDETLSAGEMQEFEDFLATIHYPPNPFRTRTNRLPTSLALDGLVDPGIFGPAGSPLPAGNAEAGFDIYTPPRLLDNQGIACVSCHTIPTGIGPNLEFNLSTNRYEELPEGPNGELHHALVAVDGTTNVTTKIPQLRNLFERGGFDLTKTENTSGFGFLHDGSADTVARFITAPVFTLTSQAELADMLAFLMSFSGSGLPRGSLNNVLRPRGTLARDTHALVGEQLTVTDGGSLTASELDLLDTMVDQAEQDRVGLVVKGLREGEARGWYHLHGERFQSDRKNVRHSRQELLDGAEPGNELTFTVVPRGTALRIGVDRDEDRAYDRDELDAGKDPADPGSRPKIRKVE